MSRISASLRAWIGQSKGRHAAAPINIPAPSATSIGRYLHGGRLPWTEGYWEYRLEYTAGVLQDAELMRRFRAEESLPAGFGQRLDERVVEYPWLLSHWADQAGPILDAGAVLSYRYLLDLPQFKTRPVIVCTLTMDSEHVPGALVSYLYGDLRYSPLQSGALNTIVCISTLEHVGLDSTQVYGAAQPYREQRPDSYRLAIQEFRRLLAPGGRLYITVPFGEYRNHGWLQQFDWRMVEDLISGFGGRL